VDQASSSTTGESASNGPASPDKGSCGISVSKQTAAKQRFEILDDCRGFAIILVFFRHCEFFLPDRLTQILYNPQDFLSAVFAGKADLHDLFLFLVFFPFHIGWTALPIFFVVSGFCIHLTYCHPRQSDLKAFYVRRFFRIYPPYLLALLVFTFIYPLTRIPFTKLTYWGQFLTHVFLCHNFSELSICAINAPFWTIPVEVQLYLIFPLILIFVRRYSYARALMVLALIEFALQAFAVIVYEHPPGFAPAWLRGSPFFFCFSWGLGAAVADAYLSGKPLPLMRIHPLVWLVPGILTSTFPAYEFSFGFFALFTASIITRHLNKGVVEERRSYLGRLIRVTGIYSYSIYLLHDPILRAVILFYKWRFPGIENHPFLIFTAGATSWFVIFPLSALMYYWVEKPAIALGKRVLRAWSQPSTRQLESSVVSTA
jgi:peptidoglycan/LPS O-acetylase OafA/YrhL